MSKDPTCCDLCGEFVDSYWCDCSRTVEIADAYAAGHAAGFADGLVLGAEACELERTAREAIWCSDWETRLLGRRAP